VPIDVHGSLDRVKDVSSKNVGRFLGACRDECVRLAHADDVPLLILPEDTCCRRCDRVHGTSPVPSSGPTKTHTSPATREGDRHPVDQGAFHRCDSGT